MIRVIFPVYQGTPDRFLENFDWNREDYILPHPVQIGNCDGLSRPGVTTGGIGQLPKRAPLLFFTVTAATPPALLGSEQQ